jgi:hypothetical protein
VHHPSSSSHTTISSSLSRLIQEFDVASSVAHRLAKAYGGRARDVLLIARDELGHVAHGRGRLVPGYPYIEAEVSPVAGFLLVRYSPERPL